MSDEIQELAEKPAEEVKDVDAVPAEQVEQVSEEAKPEGEKPEGEETEEQKVERKRLSGAQKAKRRETFLLNQLAEKERKLEELMKLAPQGDGKSDDEQPPKEEDFNGDFFAYQQAATAYKAAKAARDAIRAEFESRSKSEASTKQTEAARERNLAHLERIEDAREVIADFDKVMEGMKGVNVRPELIDEIIGSDQSALLSYHLAKHPDDLESLNALSGRELARAVGRLEATLKMPVAKKQTKAPPPIEPLKGGATGSFDPEKSAMDEYVAKRKAGWGG